MGVFKISGSRVAEHVLRMKGLKLDAKSKEGIFQAIVIGYSDNVKRYRIYFPYNEKIEILKDVIFLPKKSKALQENSIFIVPKDDQEEAYEEDQVEIPQKDAKRNSEKATGGDEPLIETSLDDVYKSCKESEEQTPTYNLRDRSKIKIPVIYDDYELGFMSIAEEEEPQTYKDAISNRESTF